MLYAKSIFIWKFVQLLSFGHLEGFQIYSQLMAYRSVNYSIRTYEADPVFDIEPKKAIN